MGGEIPTDVVLNRKKRSKIRTLLYVNDWIRFLYLKRIDFCYSDA